MVMHESKILHGDRCCTQDSVFTGNQVASGYGAPGSDSLTLNGAAFTLAAVGGSVLGGCCLAPAPPLCSTSYWALATHHYADGRNANGAMHFAVQNVNVSQSLGTFAARLLSVSGGVQMVDVCVGRLLAVAEFCKEVLPTIFCSRALSQGL